MSCCDILATLLYPPPPCAKINQDNIRHIDIAHWLLSCDSSHLSILDLVERSPDVNALSDLAALIILECVDPTVL